MSTSLNPVFIIAKREIKDQFRDWRIVFPILGLTLFFPFLMNFTATRLLDFVEQYGASIVGERLVPFLFMIVGFFPISVSLVIALESFVGEKERGSIEPLLNTPLKDWQLYVGKLISSIVPPLVGSFLGMSVYTIGLVINHVRLPDASIMIQIIVITIVQAVVMVSGGVVVSSQATSVKAANLLSSFIVIPMALLIQGESIVMFWGNYSTLWWAALGLLILAVLLIRVGLAHFNREELLGREIDVLNFRWGWHTFLNAFTRSAKSLGQWYRLAVWDSLKRLKGSLVITLILVMVGIWVGVRQTQNFGITFNPEDMSQIDDKIRDILNIWPVGKIGPIALIFWQNFRVVLFSLVLGLFSFGILGIIPLFASVGVTGYLMGLLQMNGMPIEQYLAFIVPHGIFEIPAAMIAAAAVFYIGVMLATPNAEITVGEVFIGAVADWCKVMVGVVLPLLLIAAFIEAWITPRIVMLLFS
ncbi:MAG: hypothetical protein BGO78_17320 [Chloroflexi bacterium 44-23]|nr:MAG: hypothetical protein BGO78_17320 [Chloroflexi bacterium 44-23]